jgi:hypothetical protein
MDLMYYDWEELAAGLSDSDIATPLMIFVLATYGEGWFSYFLIHFVHHLFVWL